MKAVSELANKPRGVSGATAATCQLEHHAPQNTAEEIGSNELHDGGDEEPDLPQEHLECEATQEEL